jgi:hypothetical protein
MLFCSGEIVAETSRRPLAGLPAHRAATFSRRAGASDRKGRRPVQDRFRLVRTGIRGLLEQPREPARFRVAGSWLRVP